MTRALTLILLSACLLSSNAQTQVVDTLVTAETSTVKPWSTASELKTLGDSSHDANWVEFAVPAATLATAALFVRTPALVKCREKVQEHLSNHGKDKTEVDNYLQYAPMVESYALYFCGYKGQHNLLDRTILLAMSYATFAILNNGMKYTFREQRPDSSARNSFPSGHTGTVVVGAEYLRREYWDRNKWVAMSGYAFAVTVAYLRIYNDRHWINDVVGGAALGYLSTTFAYWLYPKIFHKLTSKHYDELQSRQQAKPIVMASPMISDGFYGLNASITF